MSVSRITGRTFLRCHLSLLLPSVRNPNALQGAVEPGPQAEAFLPGRRHEGVEQQASGAGAEQGVLHDDGLASALRLLRRAQSSRPTFFLDFIMTKSTIKPQRFLVALDMKYPQHLEEASRGFWKRFYQDNKDIAEEDSVAEVGRAAGMEEDAIKDALAMIKEDEVKKALLENTKLAVDEYGAFGAPTIVAHVAGKPEVFFGSDRFEVMAHVMGKKWLGPKPAEAAKL
ncbi:hypothetical protein MTO96_037272 [Rhipicephalus appendiculatus]